MHKNQIEELGNHLQLEANLKLETLDASYNRIAGIGGASLPHSVRTLSLSDNLISVIDPNTFVEKSNLSRVDLYGNQLVTLNLNALRLSPNVDVLPEFYLGGNPFQCDCDMGKSSVLSFNLSLDEIILSLNYPIIRPCIQPFGITKNQRLIPLNPIEPSIRSLFLSWR